LGRVGGFFLGLIWQKKKRIGSPPRGVPKAGVFPPAPEIFGAFGFG